MQLFLYYSASFNLHWLVFMNWMMVLAQAPSAAFFKSLIHSLWPRRVSSAGQHFDWLCRSRGDCLGLAWTDGCLGRAFGGSSGWTFGPATDLRIAVGPMLISIRSLIIVVVRERSPRHCLKVDRSFRWRMWSSMGSCPCYCKSSYSFHPRRP